MPLLDKFTMPLFVFAGLCVNRMPPLVLGGYKSALLHFQIVSGMGWMWKQPPVSPFPGGRHERGEES